MLIRTEIADPAPIVQEFDDYDSALLASGKTFDDEIVSACVVENTRSIVRQRDYHSDSGEMEHLRLAVPMAAQSAEGSVRVLDFGGAAGLHAVLSIRSLTDVDQRWAIVETPSMVEACSVMSTDSIRFFETIEDAVDWLGGVDLAHCSEMLHYMPDPLNTLRELQAVGAQTLLVRRSALSADRKIIELETLRVAHDAGETAMLIPVTYVNQDEFAEALCDGYDIAFAFSGRPLKTVNDIGIEFGSAYLLQKS